MIAKKLYKKILLLTMGLLTNVAAFTAPESIDNTTLQQALKQSWHPYRELSLGSSGGQLVITGNGTLRFLRLFFYSDTTCSTRLGDASIIANAQGFLFTDGQSISINPSSVYKLANNQGIATDNIACMEVFLDGSNQSSDGVSCQQFTDETCSGTTCTSEQIKNVTWQTNPTMCATRYAYVTNYNNKTISKCTVSDIDGALSDCVSTGSGYNKPIGIAVNDAYAYITNYANKTVTKCNANAANGSLTNCTSTGSAYNKPEGVGVSNGYVYVLNGSGNTVTKCNISVTDGTLENCASTGSDFNKPKGIGINNSYAYITNYKAKTITKCDVSTSDGSFSNCASTGGSYNKPKGIELNNGYAYVILNNAKTVTQCTVSPDDGSLSNCTETGTGFSKPVGLRVSKGYAYVSDQSSKVFKCTVNASTGAFSDCASTGSGFNANQELYIY